MNLLGVGDGALVGRGGRPGWYMTADRKARGGIRGADNTVGLAMRRAGRRRQGLPRRHRAHGCNSEGGDQQKGAQGRTETESQHIDG